MRPAGVVPREPAPEPLLSLSKIVKLMLPHAFLFETPEEAFDDPILLRRVRRDEFLGQPVVATGGSEPAALKDESIVAPHNRHRALGPQRAKAVQAGRLPPPLRLLAPPAQGEFIANHLTIMTIDDRGQMRPAIRATGNVGHIHRPPLIARRRLTPPAAYARARGARSLMHQPALEFEDPVDHL